jgi:hypothetical protein
MALTKNDVKEIRNTIQKALDELNANSDFEAKLGNASYGLNSINFKMSVAVENDEGVLVTPEAEAFTRNARSYGFEPTDLGAEITISNGKKGTIIGLKTRNRKYPVLVQTAQGTYKLGVNQALRALGRGKDISDYFTPIS